MRNVILLSVLSILPLLATTTPTAKDIVKKSEDKFRGSSSYSRLKIKIQKIRINRSLTLDIWSDEKADKSFLRILLPKKDKGITFLQLKKNLWQYIPKIGREIKIEESLMHDSWMGSDFTNDDLVRESSIVDDYFHSFLSSQDKSLFKIQLQPKPGAAVVWGKIIYDIRKKDFLPARQELYDHKQRLRKILQFSEYRSMGGKFIPTQMKMSTMKNGKIKSSTVMSYQKIRFNMRIPRHIFSKSNLRR